MAATGDRLSIYKAARGIKRKDNSLYNALRSIYEDSVFVAEIAGLWPALPLVANLRCGLWYSPRFDASCYFKSTDGHANNCSFSTARLNLHLANLAGQRGGCIIVDSTRKGKRFPDSMSKTIPIWACVLNRVIKKHLQSMFGENKLDGRSGANVSHNETTDVCLKPVDWDCSLHLPLWVPHNEKATIEKCLEEWMKHLEDCGADIGSLASILRKPLRPLWISQKTLIWLNEVPDYDSWDFTPIILVSASATNGLVQRMITSEFSWHYISGAGDDEESWARGLTPNLFWQHAFDLIDSGPDLCNQKVAEIVENERVYLAQRGEYSPQVAVKKITASNRSPSDAESSISCWSANVDVSMGSSYSKKDVLLDSMSGRSSNVEHSFFWIGSTNLAVAGNLCAIWWSNFGDEVPELQKFAVRVLSLTCTASACERNWSTFNQVHTKRRNHLSTQKMNKLVYVMYNKRLKSRHLKRMTLEGDDLLEAEELPSDDEWLISSTASLPEDEDEDLDGEVREEHVGSTSGSRGRRGSQGQGSGSRGRIGSQSQGQGRSREVVEQGEALNLPEDVDCVLNCDSKLEATSKFPSTDSYLHLPISNFKVDKFSVISNLSGAIDFAKLSLGRGKKLLICGHNGEDISICICLAILTYLFDERGSFDGGNSFMHTCITKWELRRRLVFICKYAINARPSRGNLKQVYGFLRREWESLVGMEAVVVGA